VLRALLFLGLLLAPAAPASAQTFGVEWRRDLDFGDVWAGATATVAPTSGSAAHWHVDARQGDNVLLQFSLPAALTSGPNTVPVGFASDAAGWSRAPAAPSMTRFNPAQGTATRGAPNGLYVWLGGTLSPPLGQAGGTYTATITLIVTAN